jgi:hypothetical protein
MKKDKSNAVFAGKIYKDRQLWIGSFLCGPLVAGYIFAKNYESFGEPEKVRKTWIYAISGTIALFVISFFAPYIDRVPNILFPLVYSGIAASLMRLYQGERIDSHVRNGGQIQSWWKVTAVMVVGGIFSAILFIGGGYLLEQFQHRNESVKEYGTSKHQISFDTGNIEVIEVDKIAEVLQETNFFDSGEPWYINIRKTDTRYDLYIPVLKSALNSKNDLDFFAQQQIEAQKSFPSNEIGFNLFVDDLDNVIKRFE